MGTLVVSAEEVNQEHALARAGVQDFVKHAARCGELLKAKKIELPRGGFDKWVQQHCQFKRATAYNYIKIAESSSPLDELPALRHLFPSGRRTEVAVPIQPKVLLEQSPPMDDITNMIERLAARCRSASQENIRAAISELQQLLDELNELAPAVE